MVMQTQKNLKYYDNYTTLWISKEDYMGGQRVWILLRIIKDH